MEDRFQAGALTERDGHNVLLHGVVLVPRAINLLVAGEAIHRIRLQVIADNHRATVGEED